MGADQARKRWTTPLRWWGDHPWPDLVIAVLVAVVALTGLLGQPVIPDRGQRFGVYYSAGNIAAVVGGLAGISVSVYMGMSGARGRALRAGAGRALVRNWVWTLVATAISALACWAAQLMDVANSAHAAWAMVYGGVTWCIITSGRQAWLLRLLLAIASADQSDNPRSQAAPTPAISPQLAQSAVEDRSRSPRHQSSEETRPQQLRL